MENTALAKPTHDQYIFVGQGSKFLILAANLENSNVLLMN